MKIMVLNGSATHPSNTRGISHYVLKLLTEKGIEVFSFDLREHVLPIYTGEEEGNPTVIQLRTMAEHADGFFITSPEYHSGMSGALKNAFDFLGSCHFRTTAIAVAVGGGKGGINALNNLRTVLRGVYALVLPSQFAADPEMFNVHGTLIDVEAKNRLKSMVEELVQITGALTGR